MPPTAIDIKARLDKAVDQEGNVLDMEAVLEIVTYLEKNVITKEALETTRIGRTINLMRKKTKNEDLSRRAKKLVKKWQTLVMNNHLRRLESDSPLNRPVNGIKKDDPDRQNLRDEPDRQNLKSYMLDKTHSSAPDKPNLKRKRVKGENSPLNCKKTFSSRTIHSPKIHAHTVSPKRKSSKLVTDSNRIIPNKLKEENIHSADHGLNKTSHENELNLDNERLRQEDITSNIDNESSLSKKHIITEHSPLKNGHSVTTNFIAIKPTDTRIQEDRILEVHDTHNNVQNTHDINSIQIQSENIENTDEQVVKHFEPIEPEELVVNRRDLPTDFVSPDTNSDGINGVFTTEGTFHPWTEVVPQRNNELYVLPYVILD